MAVPVRHLDELIGLCRAVMDRLDRGEALSSVLPQAKVVSELCQDTVEQHWLNFEIYGAENVPGLAMPLQTDDQREGFMVFWKLHAVTDVTGVSVDGVIADWHKQQRRGRERTWLIPDSASSLERRIATYTGPTDYSRAQYPDDALKLEIVHSDTVEALQHSRDHVYGYVSRKWIEAIREQKNVELLGPDYRIVLEYLHALDTSLGPELESALSLVQSDNTADWSAAALVCRNVVLALGRSLFDGAAMVHRSPRDGKEYSLKGDSEKNRLHAYIDQFWEGGNRAIEEQVSRLHDLTEEVYTLGSKGKSRVRRQEVQHLLVSTFELVARLEELTGLQPARLARTDAK